MNFIGLRALKPVRYIRTPEVAAGFFIMSINTSNLKKKSSQTRVERTFVSQNDKATIVCPQCNKIKEILVRDFRHKHHRITVRCTCDHVFKIQLEFRRYHRKKTALTGTYDVFPPAVGGGRLRILDLSLSGAKFEVYGLHDLKEGTKGKLAFILDDRHNTVLMKNSVIKTVQGNIIGCEFTDNKTFDKDLGFYLRS